MNPLASVTAGLHVISSWLMSMLAILAILISVVICIAFVEFIFERGALAQAYTVKIPSSDSEVASLRDK
jgi:hypothetical protein